jgi:UDP-N-acetylglucosamine:LPS N-acetylglucosamine transferase
MHLLGEKCSWILRLHPHMQWRREELLEVIQRERLGNCIHPQTYEPLTLPETLAQASLHITRTSGTVIEAALMGVTTLILDSDGAKAYEQYISAGSAIDASKWTGERFVHFLDTQLGQ